jgi:hypothetical protein
MADRGSLTYPLVSASVWDAAFTPVASRTVTASTVSDKTGYSLTAGSYVVRASSSQRVAIALTAVSVATGTITSVTTTRASCAGTWRGSTNQQESACVVYISAATTVTAQRDSGANNANAYAEVWELF